MLYYIIFTIIFAFGIYTYYDDNKAVKQNLLIISTLIPILLVSLRWNLGPDWHIYYQYFTYCLSVDKTSFEIGYVIINKIVRTVTDNYTVFLMIICSFWYGMISYTLYKYHDYPVLAFAFFFALMFGYMGINRQFIAIAISVYSIKFVIEKRPFPFLACTLCACFFHSSGIFFAPIYFFNKEFNIKVYIIAIAAVLAIVFSGIFRHLPAELFYFLGETMEKKSDTYTESGSSGISLAIIMGGILKRSFWIILSLVYFSSLKKVRHFSLFFNIYFLSFIIFAICSGTPLQIVATRGILSLNLFEVFIVPYIIFIFKDNSTRKIFFILLFAYYIMVMHNVFSYSIETLGFDCFNPYKFVLFETNI